MKAEEARKTAKSISSIYDMVEAASKKGKFTTTVDGDTPEVVIQVLKADGYKVSKQSGYKVAADTYKIEW